MEQFNIGCRGRLEKGSPIDGGHCVVLVGTTPTGCTC